MAYVGLCGQAPNGACCPTNCHRGIQCITQRWIAATVFEDMVHELRALVRLAKGKKGQPSAAYFDDRTIQSTFESGERAGYDGYKRKKEAKFTLPWIR